MAVLRFLASLFLLIAVIDFAADATPLMAGSGSFDAVSLARQWEQIAPATLAAAKSAFQSGPAPWLWDYLINPLTALPGFIVFGLLAALCGYFGRRRNRVEIFIN